MTASRTNAYLTIAHERKYCLQNVTAKVRRHHDKHNKDKINALPVDEIIYSAMHSLRQPATILLMTPNNREMFLRKLTPGGQQLFYEYRYS